MDGRLLRTHCDELVGIGRRDAVHVETAETVGELLRSRERDLHRHLLVEQHADEKRQRVLGQQCVGVGISDQVQRR